MELKPKKTSFLINRLGLPLPLIVLVAAGGAIWQWLAGMPAIAWAVIAAGVVLAGGVVWAALVAYRKERYIFDEHQIVKKAGGPLSDRHTELKVRNITHVQIILPWLRYKFFNVGNILIDSAGSGEAMQLEALREPEKVEQHIRELMQHNGFSLKREQGLHQENPATIGVALEVAGSAIGGMFFYGFFLAPSGLAALGGLPFPWNVLAAGLILLGAPLLGIVLLTLHWLDMKRRTYTVYNDTIVYTEGFLTRNNAFIPAENLADAKTQQTLLERILSLYNVTVSCQGSGQEVNFRHLRFGPQLNAAVESVARAFGPPKGASPARAVPADATTEAAHEATHEAVGHETSEPGDVAPAAAQVPPSRGPGQADLIDETVIGTYYMHKTRAIAPWVISAAALLLIGGAAMVVLNALDVSPAALGGFGVGLPLIVLFAWANGAIRGVLAAFCTRFEMRDRSVKRIYRFTSTDESEFSSDKLTGVAWFEGPLDRLFGTCTIRFWSIGSGETLDFAHLPNPEGHDLLGRSLAKAGIRSEQTIYQMPSQWSLSTMIAASLSGMVTTLVIAIGLLVAAAIFSGWFLLGIAALAIAWVVGLVYLPIYYRRCRAIVHDRHVELRRGVFFRSREHALYDNVKHITTVRYPWTDHGLVAFSIAGQGLFTGFSISFVQGISVKDNLIDLILQRRPTAEELPQIEAEIAATYDQPVRVSRPHLGNTLAPLLVVSVVLVPLVLLLPLTVPWAIVVVRRRRYAIEPYRVVASWGVIYRKQRSIIYDKIDHIRQGQGALNKIFGNGNVLVYTAGSSTEDLTVQNIPDYLDFYDDLRKQYAEETAAS